MTVAQWQSTTKNILNISNRSYRRCYFVCPARQNNWESIIRETIELWNTATFKKGHPWDCFASSYCEISLKTVKMTYFDSLLKFFFVGLVCLSSVGGKQTFYQLSFKWIFWDFSCLILKFVYSEKATKFCLQYIQTKVKWRFRKILWPSQNIWTLIADFFFQSSGGNQISLHIMFKNIWN